jgi:hypothetical protein
MHGRLRNGGGFFAVAAASVDSLVEDTVVSDWNDAG